MKDESDMAVTAASAAGMLEEAVKEGNDGIRS